MPDLKHVVTIGAAPEKVYALVGTQAGMRSWWTADTQMEAKRGGKAQFGFDKRAVIFRMTIEALEPARRVVMSCQGDPDEWNGTTLTWDLSQDADGTKMIFVHGGWRTLTEFCSSCNTMWGNLMFRLKDTAEGNGRGPQWTE